MHRSCYLIVCPLVVLAACRAAMAAAPAMPPQELLDQGWTELFDGQTLSGWQPTGKATWEAVDGAIHTAGDKAGFLMTTGEFASFELHIEFRAPADTNSGVFLRSVMEPTDPAQDCYELNIAPPDNPFPTGSFVARKKAAPSADEFPVADQWHAFDVTVQGAKFTIALDGQRILEYDDPTPIGRGHMGLQSNHGEASFRNIRVRKTRGE